MRDALRSVTLVGAALVIVVVVAACTPAEDVALGNDSTAENAGATATLPASTLHHLHFKLCRYGPWMGSREPCNQTLTD